MKASNRQVGGTHYKKKPNGVGHWDYCTIVNVPYLEGCASKYTTRWRDKGGMEDLEKAIHYIERRLEAVHAYQGALKGANKSNALFAKFIEDNKIPNEEELIIDLIMHWKRPDQLTDAITMLTNIIDEECGPGPGYVNQDR